MKAPRLPWRIASLQRLTMPLRVTRKLPLFSRWLCRALVSTRWQGRARSPWYWLVPTTILFTLGILRISIGSSTYVQRPQRDIQETYLITLQNKLDMLNVNRTFRESLKADSNMSVSDYLDQLHDHWNISKMADKFIDKSRLLNTFSGIDVTENYTICNAPLRGQYSCPYEVRAYPNQYGSIKASVTVGGHTTYSWTGSDNDRFYVFRINRTTCRLSEIKPIQMPEQKSSNLSQYLRAVPKGDIVITVTWGMPDKATLYEEFDVPYHVSRDLRARRGILIVAGIRGYKGYSRYVANPKGLRMALLEGEFTYGRDFSMRLQLLPYSIILQNHPDVGAGGRWSPAQCVPHSTIALIIPYRNREIHLKVFLNNIITFLKLQNVAFTIFVIEQAEPEMFNRAALMNVGYRETRAYGEFDCYVFHDVDQIPEDLSNLYYCSDQPRHMVVTRSSTKYQLRRQFFFGGAIMMRKQHIEKINGFPNRMFGWGGEDDDIWARIHLVGLDVYRYPNEIARYTSLSHGKDDGNPRQNRAVDAVHYHAQFYRRDGLNSLSYDVLARETRSLFTHVIVRVVGPTTPEEIPIYLPSWAANETDLHMERFNSKRHGLYIPPDRDMYRDGEIS